jgi:hypothetical protein
MQITRFKTQYLSNTILVIVGVLVWVLSSAPVASAGTYADSAHGNGTYGVNRSDVLPDPDHPDAYDIGACAHCHDTFNDSICGVNDLMLFSTPVFTSQSDTFCYDCHRGTGTSIQVNMPDQRPYSRKIGGDTSITCPKNIRAAFRFVDDAGQPQTLCNSSVGSSHNLSDIRNLLQGRWGFDDNIDNIDPCHGCHNPHLAQRLSTVKSPISRPSTHDGNWDVYGAKTSERMDRYTYSYQPPYKYPAGSGGYEWPSGASAPDINSVCIDCHGLPWGEVVSTRYGRLEVVSGGGKHGTYHGTPMPYYGGLIDPYQDWDYVTLMCTDCHEPHGSPNEFLLRTCVNGTSGIVVPGPGQYYYFCKACHWLGSFHSGGPTDDCGHCHYHPVNF